jgi:hypothetical protein
VSQALGRARRPLLAAEAEELELPPTGLTDDERKALAGLFHAGHRISDLMDLYGLTTPRQVAQVLKAVKLPYTTSDGRATR